jgi:formylglycine-generating enzyme required for sulfatase activity
MLPATIVWCTLVWFCWANAAQIPTEKEFTNSIGMKFIRIEPGTFIMGWDGSKLPEQITTATEFSGNRKVHIPENGDYDEPPTHKVTITKPFYMGVYEVTNREYEFFDPLHIYARGKKGFSIDHDEAVVFVNWHEAKAFCDWLSEKEGLAYRLPTEAEWEYTCRAGTTTQFSTGDVLPDEFIKNPDNSWYPSPVRGRGRQEVVPLHVGKTAPNPWGLYDMHGNVEEWCYDWYGRYEAGNQLDPVGRADGDFKVTRGGSHGTFAYYLRSANRLGTLPEDKSWFIGFRVVLGEMPDTDPLSLVPPKRYQEGVNQQMPADVTKGPSGPYFRGPRNFVKIPEPSYGPLFHRHNHHPAIVECPNGDLLAVWYTTVTERGREIAVAASRLRYGEDEWEPASPFWDAPDRNDHASALWFDGRREIYHFNALSTAATWGPLAVIMRTSVDNGVTWSKARPIIPEHDSRHQVVESVFRTKEGWLVLPCDASPSGSGGTAVHISKDGGLTWRDADGTIAGIHAGVVQLKDGRLMAFGRGDEITKDQIRPWMATRIAGEIDDTYRRMTMSVSADMGTTWYYSQSPFPPVGGGQRLAFMRLKEGPLFLASYAAEDDEGRAVPPITVTDKSGKKRRVFGLFGAVSYDDGETWPTIRLVTNDGPPQEMKGTDGRAKFTLSKSSAERKGYMSVCQARDGLIHLVTSYNHYAFSLKWLETPPPPVEDEE